jgi:hypothetical protein
MNMALSYSASHLRSALCVALTPLGDPPRPVVEHVAHAWPRV